MEYKTVEEAEELHVPHNRQDVNTHTVHDPESVRTRRPCCGLRLRRSKDHKTRTRATPKGHPCCVSFTDKFQSPRPEARLSPGGTRTPESSTQLHLLQTRTSESSCAWREADLLLEELSLCKCDMQHRSLPRNCSACFAMRTRRTHVGCTLLAAFNRLRGDHKKV